MVAVSDGSTDGSDASLDDLDPDIVVRVVLPHAGKGKAVRAGLAGAEAASSASSTVTATSRPTSWPNFVDVVQKRQPDVVLGSKRHPGLPGRLPGGPALYSWGYQQLVRALFHLDVRDTQAGIKLVRREVLADVLPLMVEQGYAFDLEMLVIARRLGHRDLIEAPVRIGRRFASTVSRRVVFEMLATPSPSGGASGSATRTGHARPD